MNTPKSRNVFIGTCWLTNYTKKDHKTDTTPSFTDKYSSKLCIEKLHQLKLNRFQQCPRYSSRLSPCITQEHLVIYGFNIEYIYTPIYICKSFCFLQQFALLEILIRFDLAGTGLFNSWDWCDLRFLRKPQSPLQTIESQQYVL